MCAATSVITAGRRGAGVAERIVVVEWEDTVGRHGWSDQVVTPHTDIHSVGYVERDDDRGIILLFGRDGSETSGDPYDCSKFIPRSAIRKVTELRPKRG